MLRLEAWAIVPALGAVFAPVRGFVLAVADRVVNPEDCSSPAEPVLAGPTLDNAALGNPMPGRSRSGAKTPPNVLPAWNFPAISPRETSPARNRPHLPGCLPGDTQSSRLPDYIP